MIGLPLPKLSFAGVIGYMAVAGGLAIGFSALQRLGVRVQDALSRKGGAM